MNLFGVSINHKTAPIELREALHLSHDEIVDLIPKLKTELFEDGFILSTCNRTEIFGTPKQGLLDYKKLQETIINYKPVSGIKSEHFLKFFSCSAVKHIFSVASGIDSLIIGDSQILGQMKDAFQDSEDLHFSGSIIKRVFDSAIRVGKRAIKETLIGEGAVTVSYAAVQVVEKIYSNLEKKNALIIGAGETGELAAVHLHDKGVGKISIANRTLSKAETLARKVQGDIIPFEQLTTHLHEFDIIISATSSPDYIISFDDAKQMMKKRKGNTCVIMDIAIPRDIDPTVKDIETIFYHDMDSLKVIVDQNMRRRKEEIPKVEKIILEEMTNLFSWYNALEVVPTIKTVREFFDEIRNDELEKIKHKISQEDYEKLEDMTRRMMGRILHNPTIKLRELAEDGTHTQQAVTHALILKELFNLENRKNGSLNTHKDEE
ncbi:MAG: glutamyl-tRNA reductase [Ignavibacteriales bacterium]|nr:MAG: glutamyl-tRNA reductase [Ignavibacteriales bacterium]